jgi:hypothetical protein
VRFHDLRRTWFLLPPGVGEPAPFSAYCAGSLFPSGVRQPIGDDQLPAIGTGCHIMDACQQIPEHSLLPRLRRFFIGQLAAVRCPVE